MIKDRLCLLEMCATHSRVLIIYFAGRVVETVLRNGERKRIGNGQTLKVDTVGNGGNGLQGLEPIHSLL